MEKSRKIKDMQLLVNAGNTRLAALIVHCILQFSGQECVVGLIGPFPNASSVIRNFHTPQCPLLFLFANYLISRAPQTNHPRWNKAQYNNIITMFNGWQYFGRLESIISSGQ